MPTATRAKRTALLKVIKEKQDFCDALNPILLLRYDDIQTPDIQLGDRLTYTATAYEIAIQDALPHIQCPEVIDCLRRCNNIVTKIRTTEFTPS